LTGPIIANYGQNFARIERKIRPIQRHHIAVSFYQSAGF
jgi:hypothetical protein